MKSADEHRLDDSFALGIDGRPGLGLQFPAHAIHTRRSLEERPPGGPGWWRSRYASRSVAMNPSIFFLLQVAQIRIRAIPTVGQNFLRLLSGLLLHGFY